MRFFAVSAVLASAVSSALGVSLYLVGDSTMASHKASEGIEGWGVPISKYLTGITLVNKAVSGRSARSYWREGKWAAIQASLKSGDFVVIEFGHNDGGSPSTSDRASVTLSDGTVETVYTWPTYIKRMIDGAKSKGATPIISSTTPNNPFENVNKINFTPSRFVTYAKNAAAAKGVPYVDHFTASLLNYNKLGKAKTESYFPKDHTHTNAAGADAVALAFASSLQCPSAKGVLKQYM
ncbi:SGNH hydrolase-type esterase domain-containing protein [Rhizoctonia solani]|nr:SGNH hydrolase-type esterase domain-containing protein [Rhizoctonia solani]